MKKDGELEAMQKKNKMVIQSIIPKVERCEVAATPPHLSLARSLARSLSLTQSVYEHGRPSELLPARHCHRDGRLLRRLRRFGLRLCRLRLRKRRSLGGGGGVWQPRGIGGRGRRRERRDTGASCIGETELSTVLLSINSLPGWIGTVPFDLLSKLLC